MAKPYSRVHRLLRLLTLVQSQAGWNADKLARQFATTPRNVYRDLKQLEAAGVPLFFDKETSGYRVRGDFFMPPVQLALDESLALILLGEQIGQSEQVPFMGPAMRAIEKVRGALPRKLLPGLDAVAPYVNIRLASSEHGDGHRDVYETVRLAIAQRRALRCAYDSARSNRREEEHVPDAGRPFLFKPYCLFFGQRAWYAVGWHERRAEVRQLKLSRFSRCEITDKPYAIPEDFSLRKQLGNAWRMIRGDRDHQVELRFTGPFADTVEETHWHHTQQVDRHDDGSITFHCTVSGLDEIVWWVMGYGPHCRVVKPKELAQRVRTMAREMCDGEADET